MRTPSRLAIGRILAAALLVAAVVAGTASAKGSKPPKPPKPPKPQALTCSEAVSSGDYGKITVGAGDTCALSGTVTAKDVDVQAGGTLSTSGITISHDLKANGAAAVTICKTSVGHDLKVEKTTGSAVIGDVADAACGSGGGNTIANDANVHANGGGVDFSNNSIGQDLKVAGNTGTVTVQNNTVTGNASCLGKGLTASGNTVGGTNKGC